MGLKKNTVKASQISDKRKKELVQKVLLEGKTMVYVARKLRMRYSVARKIIQNAIDTEEIVKKQESSSEQAPMPTACKQEYLEQGSQNNRAYRHSPEPLLCQATYPLVQQNYWMPVRPYFFAVQPPYFYLNPFM